jgi:predicted nucleic acid-binding Zn ribbon protein
MTKTRHKMKEVKCSLSCVEVGVDERREGEGVKTRKGDEMSLTLGPGLKQGGAALHVIICGSAVATDQTPCIKAQASRSLRSIMNPTDRRDDVLRTR